MTSSGYVWPLRAAALLAIALVGCDDSGGSSKLVPVKGKVTLGDQPLTRGSVSFRLQDAPEGGTSPEPYGSIGSDGTYTLFTKQKEGAPIGKYWVIVESTEAPTEGATVTPKSLINPRYADPEAKLLTVEVVEKPEPGQYDLRLVK
jgi:hypothetical protein